MKKTTLLTVLAPFALACLAGCATPTAQPKAPKTASLADEGIVVLPVSDMSPPGTMEMRWEPAAEAEPEPVTARRLVAKPHLVSNKGTRGRLFVLPTTTFEH
jgi:hypothetical protein